MRKQVTIKFSIVDCEDERAARRAMNADNAYAALWDIAQQIFRPARKHGYSDMRLANALENKELSHEEVIGLLEGAFYKILSEHSISFDNDYH